MTNATPSAALTGVHGAHGLLGTWFPETDGNCTFFFFFQAEDGIRDLTVTGVQTCALPILPLRDCDGKASRDRMPLTRTKRHILSRDDVEPRRAVGRIGWRRKFLPVRQA